MIAGLLIAASIQAALSCHTIDKDRIYGRDLAMAEPAFAPLPANLEIGLAPVPGQQRTFRSEELSTIARTHHIESIVARPVCFAWELKVPEGVQVVDGPDEIRKADKSIEGESRTRDEKLVQVGRGDQTTGRA